MDTTDTRVTRAQAADLAGVKPRTINRWSALGLLAVRKGPSGSQTPATYSRAEVLRVAQEYGRPGARGSRGDSDISS